MIDKIIEPYEFLVRINNGEVSGAHVKRLEKVVNTETGEAYSEKELDVEPIELTQDEINMIKARLS